MVVDQDEIEALLAQAENVAGDQGGGTPQAGPAGALPSPQGLPKRAAIIDVTPELARILKIRVPAIVQLASRRMGVSAIRKMSVGVIIEFDKGVDDPLELLINNHPVGSGEAVKVGEHFGLRIAEIRDAATRIKSMGR